MIIARVLKFGISNSPQKLIRKDRQLCRAHNFKGANTLQRLFAFAACGEMDETLRRLRCSHCWSVRRHHCHTSSIATSEPHVVSVGPSGSPPSCKASQETLRKTRSSNCVHTAADAGLHHLNPLEYGSKTTALDRCNGTISANYIETLHISSGIDM